MRGPRVTTRRGAAAVAVAALLLSGGIWTARELRQRAQLRSALRNLQVQRALYDSHKITPDWCILASQRLLTLELERSRTRAGHVAAFRAHLRRVARLVM